MGASSEGLTDAAEHLHAADAVHAEGVERVEHLAEVTVVEVELAVVRDRERDADARAQVLRGEPDDVGAARLLGAAPLVPNPALQRYVNHVGRWLASQTERPDLPWQFGVLDSPNVNAFAVPGGTIFITRGLLESVPDLINSTLVPLEFSRADKAKLVSACEFVLEGLYAQNKIARNESGGYEAVTKAKRDRRGMIYEDFTDIEGYN